MKRFNWPDLDGKTLKIIKTLDEYEVYGVMRQTIQVTGHCVEDGKMYIIYEQHFVEKENPGKT